MPNTYTQIHIQAVFAVRYRQAVLQKEWQEELYRYITGIVQNHNHKVLQIGGMPDHVHLFFGMRPTQSLSDLMRVVKGESSEWINKSGFCKANFSWQSGYGAFSYAKSQVPRVIRYIQNQEEHHRKKTFLEEYEDFLKAFEVEYDERFVFKPLE
ncbi:IS200/IS605 family transposase [Phaeodactylibacter sp.]|uniref:IS200/IS605 family transposase n=1 Tax=Phaeodactylibacter sp. TaxID=1940289 RepID=UPI0025E906A0|nr:IS200/IS605 family transposase [Phaeodactylibacter sp.]MCI4650059.1 IS200/IS605 family transposase [Phaeodactylibacter sp.]MCI5091444.1 IS200/IS605 family transposase [Phaeodactylibacter sp.]